MDVSKSPIAKLQNLRDWRLLRGSHEWPGPAGGTCLVEAAIVARGLPYRAVRSLDDIPAEFSRVACSYLIQLNDELPDEPRQRLIPFVIRLADSAVPQEIEDARRRLVVTETERRLFPLVNKALRSKTTAWLPDESIRQLVHRCAHVAAWCAKHADMEAAVDHAIAIADAVLRLDRQTEPIDTAIALERLERARGAGKMESSALL